MFTDLQCCFGLAEPRLNARNRAESVEREKGFEPSTSTLARWHSTTELLPRTAAHTLLGRGARSSPNWLACDGVESGDDLDVEGLRHEVERHGRHEAKARSLDAARVA